MVKKQLSIEAVREAHEGLLHLVELGFAYAYPSDDLYNPNFAATCYGTAEQKASAIPLAELQRIFHERECQFVASLN